jgi:cold shock CspA family protein
VKMQGQITKSMPTGARLSFDIEMREKGPRAVNVSVAE